MQVNKTLRKWGRCLKMALEFKCILSCYFLATWKLWNGRLLFKTALCSRKFDTLTWARYKILLFVFDCVILYRAFYKFSVITNIYNKKHKGPTLMELFTATRKLNKFTDNLRCSMYAPRVTWHTSIRSSSSCHIHVNMGASIFFTAVMIRAFRHWSIACYCVYMILHKQCSNKRNRKTHTLFKCIFLPCMSAQSLALSIISSRISLFNGRLIHGPNSVQAISSECQELKWKI
jgi:hypothetical protein